MQIGRIGLLLALLLPTIASGENVIDSPLAIAGEWPTFGRSSDHSGYFQGNVCQAELVQDWYTPTTETIQQVAVGGGRVYFSPAQYFSNCYTAALDETTGVETWRHTFSSCYSVNPPSYSELAVYVQRGNHASDTHLWKLDSRTGNTIWSAPHASQWERYMAPNVTPAAVYVNGGSYGGMYGFDPSTGAQKFFLGLEQYDGWTPTFADGALYSWVAGHFRAHDPASGSTLWSLDLSWNWGGYNIDRTSVVVGRRAYVIGAALYGINLDTRQTAFTITGNFVGTPAVANGILYAISSGAVQAYDALTGQSLGTFPGDGTLSDPILVTDDALIVSSNTKTFLYRLSDGQILQQLPYGGTPSLANGRLFLAGTGIRAYSFPICRPPCATPPTVTGLATGCTAEGVTLSTAPAASYRWTRNGLDIPGGDQQSLLANQSGSYGVTVVGFDGCQSPSAPFTISLTTSPTPVIGGPNPACGTASLWTSPYSSFQWYRNGSLIPGATSSTLAAPAPGSYVVRVGANGCEGTSAPFVVDSVPAPTVVGNATGCAVVPLSTQTYSTYQWFRNGTAIAGATLRQYDATTSGDYTVRVGSPSGCTILSSARSVVVEQPPAVSGEFWNQCPAVSVRLQTASYASYQWNLDATPIPGATSRTYDVTTTGQYSVTAAVSGTCTTTSAQVLVFVDFCAGSEVSPTNAVFPLRLTSDSGSPTGTWVSFQRLDSLDGFNLYEGTLGDWYDHGDATWCDVAFADLETGELRSAVSPSAGDHYYLATAFAGSVEGPSGFDSAGAELPRAESTCAP